MARKTIKDIDGEFDVVIAGSGLGGLTAANILARNGWRVLLAEQHFQLGGLATCFRRKQHIFDVALHGFPIGMQKTLRKYWSREMAEHIIQVKSIRFDNPQFSLETTFTSEDFTNILVDKFCIERSVVDAFYHELSEMNFYDADNRVNRELFDKYFPGRNDVVRLLMEPITYANGSTLDEPAITYGIVFSNFMSKGCYTFSGGTDLMLEMMQQELEKNGATILTNAKIEKIKVNNGRVASAVINGREIKCRTVISNGNLLNTINNYVGSEHFSDGFREKVAEVRLNTSSSQVYIGFRPDVKVDFIGDLLFTSKHPVYDPEALLAADSTSRTYSVYYPEIRPGSNDFTVVASMNARYQDWAGMGAAEYQHAKDKLVENTLNALEEYIPDLRTKIDYTEAATPLTFERYTLHGSGASFGTKFEGLQVSMKLSDEVGGLFHTGSVGIIMSGWLGAANYGVITANNADKYLSS